MIAKSFSLRFSFFRAKLSSFDDGEYFFFVACSCAPRFLFLQFHSDEVGKVLSGPVEQENGKKSARDGLFQAGSLLPKGTRAWHFLSSQFKPW